MTLEDKKRLLAWWRESRQNIRQGKWWLVGIPVLLWFLSGVAEDRFFHSVNAYIDSHAPEFIAQIRAILAFKGSFGMPIIGFTLVLLYFIVRAYLKTQPGIVGNADLMIQELDISDLKIGTSMEVYELDLAAFARMEVASLDRPRTVKNFEIEMIAPGGTVYRATSEYELGNYEYQHDVSKKDDWGMTNVQRVREPMEDLAAKLRTPIQPYTHVARAWVRFEIPGVKQGHEPVNCQIKIFAIDPGGRRHEITTDSMKVTGISDDHEYAVAGKG